MTDTLAPRWEVKRTDESRLIESALRRAGFEQVDAYRYNSASIRVRVIDPRFEGLSLDKRDAMVEPHLLGLPERVQADIMSLFVFAPSELQQPARSFREYVQNTEFDDPTPSML